MSDSKIKTIVKCINQLIRPKIKVPRFARPEGCGDCTTCVPCERNIDCSCYTPVGLVIDDDTSKE